MSTSEEDREANVFALALLMPKKLVEQWLAKNHAKWFQTDDDLLKKIAKDFAVSMTVAAIRLHELGYWKV